MHKKFYIWKKIESFLYDILNLTFIILSLSDEIAGEKMKKMAKGLSCSAKGIKPKEGSKNEEV